MPIQSRIPSRTTDQSKAVSTVRKITRQSSVLNHNTKSSTAGGQPPNSDATRAVVPRNRNISPLHRARARLPKSEDALQNNPGPITARPIVSNTRRIAGDVHADLSAHDDIEHSILRSPSRKILSSNERSIRSNSSSLKGNANGSPTESEELTSARPSLEQSVKVLDSDQAGMPGGSSAWRNDAQHDTDCSSADRAPLGGKNPLRSREMVRGNEEKGSGSNPAKGRVSTAKVTRKAVHLPTIPTTDVSALPRTPRAFSGSKSTTIRGLSLKERSKPLSTTEKPKPPQIQPEKPPFITYMRSYSPIKSTPLNPASSSRLNLSPTKLTSPSKSTSLNGTNLFASIETLRAQSVLLNYHFLQNSSGPALRNFTSSAHGHLHDTFISLQDIYNNVILPMERKAREQVNIHALQAWSGGNIIGLKRKLTVLIEVLNKLIALTTPSNAFSPPVDTSCRLDKSDRLDTGSMGNDSDPNVRDEGTYTKLVEHFEAWIGWVEGVWDERDREAGTAKTSSSFDITLPQPVSALSSRNLDVAGNIVRFTAIEGLGDNMKFEMRSMANMLQILANRLEEARGLPFETGSNSTHVITKSCGTPENALPPELITDVSAQSTPETVYHLTRDLLAGMQEELQMMRELECEIVLGEEAWVGGRLREIRDAMSS